MTTEDFIIELFCRIDDQMKDVPRHSQAGLYPSELVTLGVLFALKGVGGRAFYRWLSRDYGVWFPLLPECTRWFRRLKNQRQWTYRFLVQPSLLGVIDSYGIELIHPVRRGRNPGYFWTGGAGLGEKHARFIGRDPAGCSHAGGCANRRSSRRLS